MASPLCFSIINNDGGDRELMCYVTFYEDSQRVIEFSFYLRAIVKVYKQRRLIITMNLLLLFVLDLNQGPSD